MLILSVESSCDETAVAITRDGREVLTDEILSQVDIHALYGGVVPEIASRKHIEAVAGLARLALEKTGLRFGDLDAVAATFAPGLIGAVLVGLNYAKALAFSLDRPLIPVHHIRGHIAANYIAFPQLEPPFLALVISGGHSLIVDVQDYTKMQIIGSTRDDAAGECFDKTARVLGLGYPGGAQVDKLSQGGDDQKYPLPRGHVEGAPFDMSFSGLKTAVINTVHNAQQKGEVLDKPALAASFSVAVSDVLVPRTIQAAKRCGRKKLAVAGGVAANSRIRSDFKEAARAAGLELFFPPLSLCGDNAAMIGCQGYYEYLAGRVAGPELNAVATLDIDQC